VAEPLQILDGQRLVEAVRLLDVLDLFLAGVDRQHGRDRIARGEMHHREHDDARPEQGRDRQHEPPADVAPHC